MVLIHVTPVQFWLGALYTMQKNITVNGALIAYHTEGKGDNVIIFLHGWRSNGAVWQPIFNRLINNPSILYAPDLPGFGASETPKQPFTLADYADTVIQFVKTLGISTSNLTLVGHSFGARIALKITAKYPQFAKRLILVGSGGARLYRGERTIKKILAQIIKPLFAPGFMRPLRKKIYRALGAEDYIENPELRQTLLNIINEDLAPLFPQIKTKTLIIWGENDTITPLSYGQTMARAIPHAQFKIIKNTGHYCFAQQPDEFIKIFLHFMRNEK